MSEKTEYLLTAEEILISLEHYLHKTPGDEFVKKRNIEDLLIAIRRMIGYPRDLKRFQLDKEIRDLKREIEKLKSEKEQIES